MYILFKPIEAFIENKIRTDPSKYPTNKGNFAPVSHELSYQITDVSGKIPSDLNGVFIKNGPNSQFPSKTGRHQWFEGDGMLHAFRIKNGQLWYCNRFTQTDRYLEEKKAGHVIHSKLGELHSLGVVKVLLSKLYAKIGYAKGLRPLRGETSNTAMIHHAKRTFALVESDLPFHVRIEESEKKFDIKSIGYDNYEG